MQNDQIKLLEVKVTGKECKSSCEKLHLFELSYPVLVLSINCFSVWSLWYLHVRAPKKLFD